MGDIRISTPVLCEVPPSSLCACELSVPSAPSSSLETLTCGKLSRCCWCGRCQARRASDYIAQTIDLRAITRLHSPPVFDTHRRYLTLSLSHDTIFGSDRRATGSSHPSVQLCQGQVRADARCTVRTLHIAYTAQSEILALQQLFQVRVLRRYKYLRLVTEEAFMVGTLTDTAVKDTAPRAAEVSTFSPFLRARSRKGSAKNKGSMRVAM